MKKCFLFVIFLFRFAAAQSLFPGDFVSTCAAGGYLVTKISFTSHGTFTSLTKGDIFYDSGVGTFSFKKDTIELRYDTSLHWGRDHWPKRLLMIDQSTLYDLDNENKIAKGGCFNGKDYFLQRDDFHIELLQPTLQERPFEANQLIPRDTFKTIYFKSWGMPSLGGDYDLCEDSLERKYGFTVFPVAGCVVTQRQVWMWTWYNWRMERKMVKRYGAGWRDKYENELRACIESHR